MRLVNFLALILPGICAKVIPLLTSLIQPQLAKNIKSLTFEDIFNIIDPQCEGLDRRFVNSTQLTQSIVDGLYNGITDEELNGLASETAAYMSTDHPDYGKLAARLAITHLHKRTLKTFSGTIDSLFRHVHKKTGQNTTNLSPILYEKIMKYSAIIDAEIHPERDYEFDYFGVKTLEKSYLMKIEGRIVETPQYMFMRVALGIHMNQTNTKNNTDNHIYNEELDRINLQHAFETYHLLSEKWFIHASPTLFQAGTNIPQLSSCFLLGIEADSIEGIYNTLHKCALISKSAGGIGVSVQNIRAKGSMIKGTKGVSNGLVPMLRVFDATARYVDQGGGKRPGAFAIYIEPWHADIFDVLDLRKNTGKEEVRARDLFYGLWIPDLFMTRVHEDGDWSLMCPAECPGLDEVWGEKFNQLYLTYEQQGRYVRKVKARELWYAILDAQMETGTPYMLYKDACNEKSNQQNLGTIKCSNLCTEIIEYTSPDEVAVCNLASLVLPKFVKKVDESYVIPKGSMQEIYYSNVNIDTIYTSNIINNDHDSDSHSNCDSDSDSQNQSSSTSSMKKDRYIFDHDKLRDIVKIVTRNLNKIIDINYYPVPQARRSNMRHRPIGLGVQGLADVFQSMKLTFDDSESRRLNIDIFETIYYAALEASCELAKQLGSYETYLGSPASRGLLQYDLWEQALLSTQQRDDHDNNKSTESITKRWDWTSLKAKISAYGLRNSLLVAPMPTASTAQILGYNECIEPYTSNIYARRVKAGEFIVVNPHLLKDLVHLNLWTREIRNRIIADGGSIQNIPEISPELKEIYRTVWEIKQRSLIDMAVDRGIYIDQSQSLNAFIPQPDYAKLTSMHFHSWRKGLKTGMYYLRTKPAAKAIQFTVDRSYEKKIKTLHPNSANNNTNKNTNNQFNVDKKDDRNTENTMESKINDDEEEDDNDDDNNNDSSSSNNSDDDDYEDHIYGEACISCSG